MDDILMYNSTLEQHVALLLQVFEILQQNEFISNYLNVLLHNWSSNIWGHIFSIAGVPTKPTKVPAIATWPSPKIVNDLRGFLGFTGYYKGVYQGLWIHH
jgi:hypothetical protein